ncbi:DNA polymerase gamma 1 [Candida albicans P34048]|nr:DNA polymerase gamma 1 [Candida albicans P34048]KGU25697.1 DNA polymerase gamma 1 [Candida albicans P57055]
MIEQEFWKSIILNKPKHFISMGCRYMWLLVAFVQDKDPNGLNTTKLRNYPKKMLMRLKGQWKRKKKRKKKGK